MPGPRYQLRVSGGDKVCHYPVLRAFVQTKRVDFSSYCEVLLIPEHDTLARESSGTLGQCTLAPEVRPIQIERI